ncbi:MAG: GAF domain-containing protein [Solirubrobacteraceae bacterium]|nr:GAF domain-containing protein [Patulibacter sp.]
MRAGDDPFVTLIAGLDDPAPASDFHSQLCQAMCESVGLERGVLFQYDADLRQVRPLGSYGIEPTVFREVYVSADTASFVRDALERDDVVEITGEPLVAQTPSAFMSLVGEGRSVVCTPMIAAGRWVGLMLADRPGTTPLTAEQRSVLGTLGKGVALATMARRATRRDERTRELRERIDLARDVHDGVVQRLFGVSLALGGDGPLPAEDRARCAQELQAAMGELRAMVSDLGVESRRPTAHTFVEELERWRSAHEDVALSLEQASPGDVPAAREALAQTMLAESLRNARKHGEPTRIAVRTARVDDTLVVEVENDGAPSERSGHGGAGLRILGIQALQAGGVLEFGAREAGTWQVRLVVPVDGD